MRPLGNLAAVRIRWRLQGKLARGHAGTAELAHPSMMNVERCGINPKEPKHES